MRALLILLIIIANLKAYTYENQLMQIYAKISPRLMLMTSRSIPIEGETIKIAVLYEKGDSNAAGKLVKLIQEAYPQGLKNRSLQIRTVSYTQALSLQEMSLFFLLESDAKTIQPIIDFAKQQQILTVAYDNQLLAKGAIVSLHVGKTVRPYLNIKAARESRITFDHLLMKISKIYYAEEE